MERFPFDLLRDRYGRDKIKRWGLEERLRLGER
jgi:hypothetical protein